MFGHCLCVTAVANNRQIQGVGVHETLAKESES